MPRVQVIGDSGNVIWSERIASDDFETDHFRRCLSDRLGWAVADAEQLDREEDLRFLADAPAAMAAIFPPVNDPRRDPVPVG